MKQILINGKPQEIEEGASLLAVLLLLKQSAKTG